MTVTLFIELLLKSGVIAGAGLLVSAALRARPATDVVDVLRATVLLLLALPALMLVLPALAVPLLPASEPIAEVAAAPLWSGDIGAVGGVAVSASVSDLSPTLIAALVWAVGVVLILGRFALGLLTLVRWTHAGKPVTASRWTTALDTLSSGRRPRLIASASTPAPLSWGLPPGVVLISEELAARPDCAQAVLAHELAHIRRRDWLFLLLSRAAVALFWFNPLVWWLHARLAARTEDAADAAALRHLAPEAYARTLVGLAADVGRPAGRVAGLAAVGLTGPAHSLSKRITRIMKTPRNAPSRPLVLALAVGGLAVVATPLAALELTSPASVLSAAETPTTGQAAGARQVIVLTDEHTVQVAPPAPPAPPPPPAPVSQAEAPVPPAPP
uniref:M56 family metallopeptidase n=1 Tax=Brevundimonas sp. FT23028 TaxID=3393748 RepID=UPI003B587E69